MNVNQAAEQARAAFVGSGTTSEMMAGFKYHCPIDGWVRPNVWGGTGFRQYVCPHCDFALDYDPFGDIAYEQRTTDQDNNENERI